VLGRVCFESGGRSLLIDCVRDDGRLSFVTNLYLYRRAQAQGPTHSRTSTLAVAFQPWQTTGQSQTEPTAHATYPPPKHRQITLEELKAFKEGPLKEMALFRTTRLSVQPVTAAEWEFILGLEDQAPGAAGGASEVKKKQKK